VDIDDTKVLDIGTVTVRVTVVEAGMVAVPVLTKYKALENE